MDQNKLIIHLSSQLDPIKLAVQTNSVCLLLSFVSLEPFISFDVIKMETQSREYVQTERQG
jgi:hypothetical protein